LQVGENYHSLPLAVTPNSQPPFSPTPSSSLSPTRQQAGRHLLAAPPMASSALLPLLAELLHSSGSSSMAAQLLPHGANPLQLHLPAPPALPLVDAFSACAGLPAGAPSLPWSAPKAPAPPPCRAQARPPGSVVPNLFFLAWTQQGWRRNFSWRFSPAGPASLHRAELGVPAMVDARRPSSISPCCVLLRSAPFMLAMRSTECTTNLASSIPYSNTPLRLASSSNLAAVSPPPMTSTLQQPQPARPSTPQRRRCPCLCAVQIPATSLAEHCPAAACTFASRVGARRIAAASHALRLRFSLPCATTRSSSRHMCSNPDRGLIW
jgi:hypothetical protein